MISKLRYLILATAALALLPGGLAKADTIIVGQLYVADYGLSALDRYQYTFDSTTGQITSITPNGIGGNTTNALFLGGSGLPIKEGLQGTNDDLIVVVGAHGNTATTLERFTLDGTYIGTIPVDFSPYNGGNVGIGNVVITQDGKYEYAPLETANAIVKIDLSNGNIVDSFTFSAAHDLAIAPNGDIYAANYSDGSAQIIRLDSNLNFIQTLVSSQPSGVSGSFRPSGLSIAADGSLYVQDNTRGGSDSVLHFTLPADQSTGLLTANFDSAGSYIGSGSNNALDFTFGNNIGPDGNLYIASLGGGGGIFGAPGGFVDGINEFNTTTNSVSEFIAGFAETSGPIGASGLEAPKYLQFDTNFVPANDAGFLPAPEPGTIALLLSGFACLAALKRSRRRKT